MQMLKKLFTYFEVGLGGKVMKNVYMYVVFDSSLNNLSSENLVFNFVRVEIRGKSETR